MRRYSLVNLSRRKQVLKSIKICLKRRRLRGCTEKWVNLKVERVPHSALFGSFSLLECYA